MSKAVLMGDEGCGGTALLELHWHCFVMVMRALSFSNGGCCSRRAYVTNKILR